MKGIGVITYMTIGRIEIKITLNWSLSYYFESWVGDQVGQEAILGLYFMVTEMIRLDLADGTLCLPDEVRISSAEQSIPYRSTIKAINVKGQHVVISVGGWPEVRIGENFPQGKLWLRRDVTWVSTPTNGSNILKYLQLTKINGHEVIFLPLGLMMINNIVPRSTNYNSVGSRRYH